MKTWITEIAGIMTAVGAGLLTAGKLLPPGKLSLSMMVVGTFLSITGGALLGARISKKLSAIGNKPPA